MFLRHEGTQLDDKEVFTINKIAKRNLGFVFSAMSFEVQSERG